MASTQKTPNKNQRSPRSKADEYNQLCQVDSIDDFKNIEDSVKGQNRMFQDNY